MKISCLNEVGSYSDDCPLCKAVAAGDTSIGKAKKQVFVQMMCAYIDKDSNSIAKAQPVIWERPAGFVNDLKAKIRDYGDLKELVFKVTRLGVAGDTKTSYSIDFLPLYNKPEYVPADFSAFTNFNIAKHSYWVKTAEEIETFLSTGSFPEAATAAKTTPNTGVSTAVSYANPAAAKLESQVSPFNPDCQVTAPVNPAPYVAPTQTVTPPPAATPSTEAVKPKFGNFKF